MATDPHETARRAASSTLCAMLQAIAGALRADSGFATSTVTVLTEDDGDIDTAISEAVGNHGICCTAMFAGTESRNAIPGLCFDSAKFILEISEQSAINRANSGRPALEMAEAAAAIIEKHIDSTGRCYLVERIIPAPGLPENADIAYHIIITTRTVKIKRKTKG